MELLELMVIPGGLSPMQPLLVLDDREVGEDTAGVKMCQQGQLLRAHA